MNYCLHCGSKTKQHTKTYYECEGCGYKHYRNPVATVGIFLHKGDGVIVCSRRRFEPYKGDLDCIGGFLDIGENIEEALIREIKEEAGVDITPLDKPRYITSVYNEYPWMGMKVPLICALFIIDIKPDVKLVPTDDVESFEEFDLKQPFNEGDFKNGWMYELLQATKLFLNIP